MARFASPLLPSSKLPNAAVRVPMHTIFVFVAFFLFACAPCVEYAGWVPGSSQVRGDAVCSSIRRGRKRRRGLDVLRVRDDALRTFLCAARFTPFKDMHACLCGCTSLALFRS